jgi:hypothetical protein
MRKILLITFMFFGLFNTKSQTNNPPKKNPAEMMREMRLQQLTAVPTNYGEKPTVEFPRVCAVIMDWPIKAATVTCVARDTGDASLYTTGTFGVIGGIGHDAVRTAAKECVKVAQRYYDVATPTKEFPYPTNNRVRIYLLCYDGVRMIDADLDAIQREGADYRDLYSAAQRVITELRIITQKSN